MAPHVSVRLVLRTGEGDSSGAFGAPSNFRLADCDADLTRWGAIPTAQAGESVVWTTFHSVGRGGDHGRIRPRPPRIWVQRPISMCLAEDSACVAFRRSGPPLGCVARVPEVVGQVRRAYVVRHSPCLGLVPWGRTGLMCGGCAEKAGLRLGSRAPVPIRDCTLTRDWWNQWI